MIRIITTALFVLLNFLSPVSAQEKVKVGAILPLSGPVAPMGEAVRNGIILFQERNSQNSIPFDVIFEDSAYDGKTTVGAFRKLAKVDDAPLVMVWGNTPAQVAAPLVSSLGVDVAFVSHDSYSTKIPRSVEIGPQFDSCLGVLSEAVEKAGPAKFGTIGIDIGNVIQFLDALDVHAQSTLSRDIIAANANSYQSLLMKGKSKGINTYLLALLPDQALSVLSQAKALQYPISTIGIDAFADDSFLEKAVEVAPDLRFIGTAFSDWFAKEYRKRFGNTSFLTEAASGYVYGSLAAHFSTGKIYPGKIRDSLQSLDRGALPLKFAQLTKEGHRITSPCVLVGGKDYLAMSR